MAPLLTIKDLARETQLVRARVVVCCVVIACMTLAIIVRLIDLQVLEHEHFATLSEDNRVKVVPVPPTRGLIFDRNGVVLAENTPTYSLEVVPEAVQDMDALLSELREIIEIEDGDEKRFREELKRKRRFDSVPLRYRLNESEVAAFAVNRHRFPGVDVQARLTRDYPLGEIGAHAIGYVGRINEYELQQIDQSNYRGTSHIGKIGVEQYFEDVLHGQVGYQHVETNALGRTLRVLKRHDPVPGSNIYLTIDISLQAVAENALGDENGAVVAIEPSTGAVLAFASVPSYDLNLFVDGIDHKSYQALLSSPDRPLFNRVLNGRYPPGSTVKPFVALAGLALNVEHAKRNTYCRGWYRLAGNEHRYRDWKKGGHGTVGLKRAIVESCDVFFYELALEMGIDRMHDFLNRFGFGRKTGIDLARESTGLMPSVRWKRQARNQPWYPGETLIAGIGQGFMLSTPLQLASATATLSMRGLQLKPQLVLRRVDPPSGETVELTPEPVEVIDSIAPANWQTVIDAMTDVVHGARGTARHISVGATYRMAGKTGTAQVFTVGQDQEYKKLDLEKKLQDHGLFIAFAPVERPAIAVAVLVEHGGSGSRSAAPIAREVIDHWLSRSGRDGEQQPVLTASVGAYVSPVVR